MDKIRIKAAYFVLFLALIFLLVQAAFFAVPLQHTLQFYIVGFFVFFVPGHVILRAARQEFQIFKSMAFSTSAGIVFSVLAFFMFSMIGMQNFFFVFPAILTIIFLHWPGNFFKHLTGDLIELSKENIAVIIVIFLLLVSGALFFYPNAIFSGSGTEIFEENAGDSLFHLSLAQNMLYNVPPETPGFTGASLKGYHFYSMAPVSIVKNLSPEISIFDIFFRLMPTLYIFLLGLNLLFFLKLFFGNAKKEIIALFLVLFGAGFSFLVPLLTEWNQSKNFAGIFGEINIASILNYTSLSSLAVMFAGMYFLLLYLNGNKNLSTNPSKIRDFAGHVKPKVLHGGLRKMAYGKNLSIISGLFFGSLIGFKTYSGVLIFSALAFAALFEFLKHRNTKLFKVLVFSLLVASPVLIMNMGAAGSSFSFSPLFIPMHYFLKAGIAPIDEITSLTEMPFAKVLLFAFAALFFLAGAIGFRALGFQSVGKRLSEQKAFGTFLFFFMALAFVLAFFFKAASPIHQWNTEQFFFYFLIGLTFFAADNIAEIIEKPNSKTKKALFIAIVLAAALPSSVQYVVAESSLLGNPYSVKITQAELNALAFIKQNSSYGDVLLHNLADFNAEDRTGNKVVFGNRNSMAEVFSSRNSVLGERWIAMLLSLSWEERAEDVEKFFSTSKSDEAKKIIEKYSVDFVFVQKGQGLDFDGTGFLEKVFEQDGIRVYRTRMQN